MKNRRTVFFSTIVAALGGLAVGGSSVVAPMYIAEIAPAPLRGRLVAVSQLNVVTGILLAFFSNYVVAQIIADGAAWRWMFGVEAAPAALFFAVKVMPETKGLSLEELEVKLGIGTAELEALEERLHADAREKT